MPLPRRFPPPWMDEVEPAPLLPCTSPLRIGHAGKGQGGRYASLVHARSRSSNEREQRIVDLGRSDWSHIAGQLSLGRSAIRDFGLSRKPRFLSSNRRRKTHRTRPSASKRDGREAFDGSQCVCIL